jgi:hypothetical protein
MAGRPRRMLKRLQALADAAYNVAAELSALFPQQYRQEPLSKTDAGMCWHRAYRCSLEAFDCIYDLKEMIRVKAGIPAPYADDEDAEDAEPTDSEATEATAGAESEEASEPIHEK